MSISFVTNNFQLNLALAPKICILAVFLILCVSASSSVQSLARNSIRTNQDDVRRSLESPASRGDGKSPENANDHLLEEIQRQRMRNQQRAPHDTPQPNCTMCRMREDAKLGRIEAIKAELLQKLGLKEPPNVIAPDLPHINGLMGNLNMNPGNFMSDQPYDQNYHMEHTMAKTERIFAFASEPPVFLGLPDDKSIAYFKFSSDTLENHVDNATLRFHVRQADSFDETQPFALLVATLFEIHHKNGSRRQLAYKTFKKDLRSAGHWDEFHVTKLVRHWFKKPERNYGLVVEVMYNDRNLAVMPKTADSDKNPTYIELSVSESEQRRRKRQTPMSLCNQGEKGCCLLPLEVDFDEFDWKWIAFPKRYNAHYCGGQCRFRSMQLSTHAHMVEQVHKASNSGINSPCCHATLYGPLTLIYFNNNNELVKSTVPNMVALRCGCA